MRIKTSTLIVILLLAVAALTVGILVGTEFFKLIRGEVLTQTAETSATVPEITSKTAITKVAGIPERAYTVLEQVLTNQGEPPPGYRGGRTFYNDGRSGGQRLPANTTYREYDINPYVEGQNRGAERLVIGSNGSAWYTADHYQTFVRIR